MHVSEQMLHPQGPEEAELLLFRKGYKAPYWRAPELLRGEPPTKATDVYAYGMLLYEVLYRREPFEKENKEVSLAGTNFGTCQFSLDHKSLCSHRSKQSTPSRMTQSLC